MCMSKLFITNFVLCFVTVLGDGRCSAESTNGAYITVLPKAIYEDLTKFNEQELANAATNVECRAAQLDPDGHWGPESEGFQLSLRLARTNYTSGEHIPCVVLLRNTTDEVRLY